MRAVSAARPAARDSAGAQAAAAAQTVHSSSSAAAPPPSIREMVCGPEVREGERESGVREIFYVSATPVAITLDRWRDTWRMIEAPKNDVETFRAGIGPITTSKLFRPEPASPWAENGPHTFGLFVFLSGPSLTRSSCL